MSMEYVRNYYGVPAKRGGRIKYTPDIGNPVYATILSATHYLFVRFDNTNTRSGPLHPTWQIEYLD